MPIEVREESISRLSELGAISIAFEVRRILEVSTPNGDLGGLSLSEERIDTPYVIDHDARAGEGPLRWAKRFDLSNWGLLFALVEGSKVGGALIAFDTPNLFMLEGGRDIAALWDLRVDPEFRRGGVGRALVAGAEAWARVRGCRWLKIETQNVNVTACEFYAQQGYVLRSVDRFAYDGLPDEAELIYAKELRPNRDHAG
jgi:GNAT superfamily N-acetyltransferase